MKMNGWERGLKDLNLEKVRLTFRNIQVSGQDKGDKQVH